MPLAGRAAVLDALAAGRIVGLPTESSYALAGRIDRPGAMDALAGLKPGRRSPVGIMVAGPDALDGWVAEVPPPAQELIERHWPGPLTVVLPATGAVPEVVTAGTGAVGVRQPGLPVLVELLAAVGAPVTATSANRPGEPPICTAAELLAEFPELVVWDAVDPTPGGQPSTVVAVEGARLRVLRPGAVALDGEGWLGGGSGPGKPC